VARYIIAVSGGVDSVALLDMMARQLEHDVVVAHVDHGIRPDSFSDARFVAKLARSYRLPFETVRYELGPNASEEKARLARYDFLRQVARKHGATVVTAHHSDDVIESIAIHVSRGTGWRGLATHQSDIARPLLGVNKDKLQHYAKRNGLKWREDSTNHTDAYLRNRIRRQLAALPAEHKDALLALRRSQIIYRQAIEAEVKQVIGDGPHYSRYFFAHVPPMVASECLRTISGARLTRPQRERALHAIKTAVPGAQLEAGSGVTLHFTTRQFSVALL